MKLGHVRVSAPVPGSPLFSSHLSPQLTAPPPRIVHQMQNEQRKSTRLMPRARGAHRFWAREGHGRFIWTHTLKGRNTRVQEPTLRSM